MIRYFRAITQQSPWMQLLFFGAITACSLILANVLGQLISILAVGFQDHMSAIAWLGTPELVNVGDTDFPTSAAVVLSITQIASQAGLFIMPPLIFAFLLHGHGFGRQLALSSVPAVFPVLMVIALTGLVLPLISWLTEINMKIELPPALALAEVRAEIIINLLLKDHSISGFLLNILMIAIIPAAGEELFFRGVIQKYLTAGLKNVHLAVIITAILFSFFHFQFHGFLPRMLLGIIFGYLLVWTGNLWVPMIAHLVNNGAAVVVEFMAQRKLITTGYQDFGSEINTLTIVASVVTSIMICAVIRHHGRKKMTG